MQDKTDVSHSTPGRWARLCTGGALVALSLSGCAVTNAMGIYWEGARPKLPQLSAEELALQSVARHDAALQEALTNWQDSEDASACTACVAPVQRFAEHAAQRVERVGGVWDPWPGGVPSNAPTLEALAIPAPEVSALVEQAITSAVVDLRLATQAQPETRRLVGAAAGGRIADALSLAGAAGLESEQLDAWFQSGGAQQLPQDFTADDEGTSEPAATASTSDPTATGQASASTDPAATLAPLPTALASVTPTPPSPAASPTPLPESAHRPLARAIRDWDCVQDLLPRWAAAPDLEGGPAASEVSARLQVDDLANTIATLLAHEVPDQRLGSCTAHFSDYLEDAAPEGSNAQILSALENRLAATNLELFVALPQLQLADLDSARGLPLAAEQLARGVQFWAKVSGPENVPALVGLVTEVEVTGS